MARYVMLREGGKQASGETVVNLALIMPCDRLYFSDVLICSIRSSVM